MKTHLAPSTRDFSGAEFALVIALAFGMSIVGSLSAALSWSGRPIAFGDAALAFTVGYEILVGALVALVLRSRHWRWSDFAVHASAGTTVLGAVMALGILAAWMLFEALVGKVPATVSASLPWIAAVSIVNPWFEELLVLAYVVQSMRNRFGLVTAMNLSLAIRLSYHLYEGPMAVIPIAVFGLVATVAYVRLGRLWPVVVMHAILDFTALATAGSGD